MPPTPCDHDGRCEGRQRFVNGLLVREIVCGECKHVVKTLGATAYTVVPVGINQPKGIPA